jgi:hypothetical protein
MALQMRIKAREAVFAARQGNTEASELLFDVARKMRDTCKRGFSTAAITAEYALYAGLMESAARLALWTAAIRSCEADADRYLRGAKLVAQDSAATSAGEVGGPSQTCIELIAQATSVNDVISIYEALLAIPLPVASPLPPPRPRVPFRSRDQRPPEPNVVVAFTSFTVDGKPFEKNQLLSLDIGYDLEVKIGLSNWPEHAEELWLEPLSVEPSDSYELPSFSFLRPSGESPFSITASRRIVVKRANSFLARPLEFSYRARFSSSSSAEITTQGQRHLTVRCFDSKSDPLSGYEQVDLRLIPIRDLARRGTGISDIELNNMLLLLAAVGGIAGQALQDNLFPGPWSEQEFQSEMKRLLRLQPKIGSQLEEHPHASGGITDLSFRQIRLELKVIDDHYVTRDDVLKFIPQTVQYVAGSDKRFGVLCVLDTSPKDTSAGSVADDISYEASMGPTGTGLPIGIGTVVVRGNLPKPSSLSRK